MVRTVRAAYSSGYGSCECLFFGNVDIIIQYYEWGHARQRYADDGFQRRKGVEYDNQ